MKSVSLACVVVITVVTPAAAQQAGQVEVAAAYTVMDEYLTDVPSHGFHAAIGIPTGQHFAVIGEVSGSYRDGGRVHAFLGGGRVVDRHSRVSVFAQGLAGISRVGAYYYANSGPVTGFTLQPGAGFDVHLSTATSIRAQVDYQFILAEFGERSYTRNTRLSVGVAHGFGRK